MKITLKYSEKQHFVASAREFTDIYIDEPESFHGENKGPSPVEYFLIGVGGCMGSTFTYCLQKQDIEIESLEIVVDGHLKHAGSKMSLQLVKIDAEILLTVKNGESPDKIEHCLKTFREYCIVSNSLTHGIPIEIKVSKNE